MSSWSGLPLASAAIVQNTTAISGSCSGGGGGGDGPSHPMFDPTCHAAAGVLPALLCASHPYLLTPSCATAAVQQLSVVGCCTAWSTWKQTWRSGCLLSWRDMETTTTSCLTAQARCVRACAEDQAAYCTRHEECHAADPPHQLLFLFFDACSTCRVLLLLLLFLFLWCCGGAD